MLMPLPELELMPKSAQRAVLLTFAGWCVFLYSTYAYYDPNSLVKFTVAGGIVCYYLYKGKRWARVMAMLAGVFIVLYGGFFAFLFAGQNPSAMGFSVANVVLFGAAFYYLAIPETGRFFKQKASAESPESEDPSDSAPKDD
jgi:hypothetical protein